jgi:hypothetical protein
VKVARFIHENETHFGLVVGDGVDFLEGDPIHDGINRTGQTVPVAEVDFVAPSRRRR